MIEHHKDDLYNDVNSEDVFDFLRNNNFEILYSLKFPFMDWEDRIFINKRYKSLNIT